MDWDIGQFFLKTATLAGEAFKKGLEQDFGLVLRPDAFGLGPRNSQTAITIGRSDTRVLFVTLLPPLSRTKVSALKKLGTRQVGEVEYNGAAFSKSQLATR